MNSIWICSIHQHCQQSQVESTNRLWRKWTKTWEKQGESTQGSHKLEIFETELISRWSKEDKGKKIDKGIKQSRLTGEVRELGENEVFWGTHVSRSSLQSSLKQWQSSLKQWMPCWQGEGQEKFNNQDPSGWSTNRRLSNLC